MSELSESEKAEQNRATLAGVLADEIAFSGSRATLNHYASLALMLSALACSLAAAILGITGKASSQVVGGIAALPAILAYTAITLKLEAKSSWHYHKYITLRALLSRLNFELPHPLRVEDVKAVSEEKNKFNDEMRLEFERDLTLDFPGIGKRK